MFSAGTNRWYFLSVLLTLLAVSAPANATADSLEVALQVAELPFLLLTVCACLLTFWALFRWPVALPSKLLAKAMLLLAVGFALMAAAQLKVLYQQNFSPNLFETPSNEQGGDILWVLASLFSWVFIAVGLILILGFVIRQQTQNNVSTLSKRNHDAEKDSNIDPLTHIWNRRFLFRDGEALVEQLRSDGASVCLLSMDLDHFKSINDKHGRAAGDMALKHFCEVVKSNIRGSDRFARNGGEEFVLLMPSVTQDEAYRIANRILISVERQPISFEGAPIHFTVSMGMVYREQVDMTIEELLVAADKALYEAKEGGRNRLSTNNISADLENVVAFNNAD